MYPQLPRPMSVAKLAAKLGQNRTNGLRITISDKGLGIRGKENGIANRDPVGFVQACAQSNAAPTMIFRINNHGDPCEIEFVCVGWPLASPPVPCI